MSGQMFSRGIANEEIKPPIIAVGIRHTIPGRARLGFMVLAYA
jgi:hypothetical protein